jgi:predicted porin
LAATSAFAQTTVEIYGRAHVAYDAIYKTTGGTTVPGGEAVTGASASAIAAGNGYDLQNRRRVADDGSRIGFRVTEDLGSGAYAKAVIETGINLDTNSANGQSGGANSGTGFFGSRDAWVGLGSAQGDIRLGRQNNFWGNGAIEDVGANRIHFSINGAYTAPSSGWISGPAARVDNTLKFVANRGLAGAFAGSEIWIAHPNAAEQAAPNTAATNVTSAGVKGNQAGDVLAKAQGITLKFNQGPWAAQYDYAQNKNQLNGVQTAAGTNSNQWTSGPATLTTSPNADSTLTGAKLGLAYSYADGSKVYFINSTFKQEYATLSSVSSIYAIIPAAANSAPLAIVGGDRKQSNNLIGIQHRIGAWELHAAYVKQGDLELAGETLNNSGSKAYTLGARYELSKRTALTVATTQIKNDTKNNINNSGGGQSSVAAIGYGAKLTQFGASVQHNF